MNRKILLFISTLLLCIVSLVSCKNEVQNDGSIYDPDGIINQNTSYEAGTENYVYYRYTSDGNNLLSAQGLLNCLFVRNDSLGFTISSYKFKDTGIVVKGKYSNDTVKTYNYNYVVKKQSNGYYKVSLTSDVYDAETFAVAVTDGNMYILKDDYLEK